LVEKTAYI